MTSHTISITNTTGNGANVVVFQRPPQSGGLADIAWRTTPTAPSTGSDWSSSYADLDKIGSRLPAWNPASSPSERSSGAADAYDASGKGQTWDVTNGIVLYL